MECPKGIGKFVIDSVTAACGRSIEHARRVNAKRGKPEHP
jgi:hypothetical protein